MINLVHITDFCSPSHTITFACPYNPHKHTHAPTHSLTCTYTHTCTHAHTHAHSHTCTYTQNTHIQTCTHTTQDGARLLDPQLRCVRTLETPTQDWARNDPHLVSLLCKETTDAGASDLCASDLCCASDPSCARRLQMQVLVMLAVMCTGALLFRPLIRQRVKSVMEIKPASQLKNRWSTLLQAS